MASTSKPVASSRGGVADEADAHPVDQAEEILESVQIPRATPARVTRFVSDGRLERVLALYSRAMREEPAESSYPWNLAASLDRLGLSDLALPYAARAVRSAEVNGDGWLAGAHAYVAWAEIAINADEPELAAVLLRKARDLDADVPVERYERKLRRSAPAAGSGPASNQDSARKGTAVEHLIAAHCMLASDFELNVSTTLVDDEGVDLVFHRRGSSATIAVQVKSRSWTANTMQKSQTFTAQVRSETFRRRHDLYMLFVAVDARFGEYGPVWFVSSDEFAKKVEPNSRNRLRFVASANPASRDRWSQYRLERSELPGRVLAEIARLEDEG